MQPGSASALRRYENSGSAILAGILCVLLLLASDMAQAQSGRSASEAGQLLLSAARDGNTSQARVLLDGPVEVNATEADGMGALHYAVLNNQPDLVERLLRAGADADARTRYGVTPVYLAAVNGNAQITTMLLEAGANANELYREGQTVLMTAARTGDVATVALLLDAGAEVDAREDWHGQTALMWAVAQNHAALVPLLVARGADVNARSRQEEWERQVTDEPREKWLPPGGMSPLHFAAREGCADCIVPLLDAGADINAVTPKDISPLLIAIINGHYDVAWELVEAGADVNINDDTNRSPLYAAVHFNTMPESNRPSPDVYVNAHTSLDLIRLLIEKGADVNVQLNQIAPYRLKLDRGADAMLVAGTTPFLRAAKSADIEVMQLLLANGADPALATVRGINPLMTAANLGTAESDTTGRYKTEAQIIEAISICLAEGLDVNAMSQDGRSAVFGAATFGLTKVVEYLVAQGAQLDYTDRRGLSPLDAAMGKAGGFGFSGSDGVYQEETVAWIRSRL
jgi:ankyrin repeat protein